MSFYTPSTNGMVHLTLPKLNGCNFCCVVPVALADDGDVVSLHTGWFIVANISTLDYFIA